MGLPESVAESLSRSRAPRAALARDFALAFLRQEKELLLRSAQLDAISREIQSLTMRHLAARDKLSIRGIFGAAPMPCTCQCDTAAAVRSKHSYGQPV